MEAIFTIGGAIGGFILNIFLKIGHNYIDEKFRDRARDKEIKLKLADQIMDICVEGSSVGWNVAPGSQRHIQRIIAEIEAVDMETAAKLKQILSIWILNSIHQQPKAGNFIMIKEFKKEDIETARKWQNAASCERMEKLGLNLRITHNPSLAISPCP